jgi:hypothetical protein
LVSIGLVFSEEKIFEKVYDIRRTPRAHMTLWSGELKITTVFFIPIVAI